MSYYLWEMRPYFRQVAGQLVLGSIAGIIMNTAVVLPAILLGQAIDAALAFERGAVGAGAVGWAALAFVGGTLLTEVPRIAKRWWLMTANARIRANIRADAWRGVIAWPMARLDSTPAGDVMARIIGDVEVLGVGVREFSIETWDTILFSLSLMVAMLIYDPTLTMLALLPVPLAMLLAKATGRWVASRTTASRQASASLTTALQEQLAGIRVLRLFGRTGAAVERVDTLSGEQADTNLALVRLRGGLRPVYTTLMSAGVLFVVWQGGEKAVSGTMTVGAFIAYLELYLRFVNRGFRVPQMINSIQGGAAAYARLRPLLAPPPPLSSEPPGASFRAGHIVGLQEPAPALPAVPTWTGSGLTARGHLPILDCHRSSVVRHLAGHSGWRPGRGHGTRWRRQKRAGQGPAGPVPFRSGPGAFGWLSPGGHSSGRARYPYGLSPPGPLSLFWHRAREYLAGLGHPASGAGPHRRCRDRSPGPGLGCVLCRPR